MVRRSIRGQSHRVNAIVLYLLCALGAVGIAIALPRKRVNPQILGAVIAAAAGGLALAALGLHAVRTAGPGALPNLYFYVFALVGLGAALRVITHPKPVYAALYFVLTVLASAGLFLLLSAEFMAFALIIIYAGAILITYLFVIMLATQAPDEGETEVLAEYDLVSREPILATLAGFVLLGAMSTLMFRGAEAIAPPVGKNPDALITMMPRRIEESLKASGVWQDGWKLQISENSGEVAFDEVAGTVLVTDASGKTVGVKLSEDLRVRNIEHVGFSLLSDHPGSIEIAGVILLMAMLGAVVLSRKQVQLDEDAKERAVRAIAAADAADPGPNLGVPAPGAGGFSDAAAGPVVGSER